MLIQRHADPNKPIFRASPPGDEGGPQTKAPANARVWVEVPLKEIYEQHQKEGEPLVSPGCFNLNSSIWGDRPSAPITVLEGSLAERGISRDKTAFQAINLLNKQCLKNWGTAAAGVGLVLAGVGALALAGIPLLATAGAGTLTMALGTGIQSAGLAVGGLIGGALGWSMFTGRQADSDYMKEQAALVQRLAKKCTVPSAREPGA